MRFLEKVANTVTELEEQERVNRQNAAANLYVQNFCTYGYLTLLRALFAVLQELYPELDILRPLTAENLPVELHWIGGFPFAVFAARLRTLEPKTSDYLLEGERRIQAATEENLLAGKVWGMPPSYDRRTPAIVCGPLSVVGDSLYIPLALADYSGIQRWWWSRRGHQPHAKAPADPFDDVL